MMPPGERDLARAFVRKALLDFDPPHTGKIRTHATVSDEWLADLLRRFGRALMRTARVGGDFARDAEPDEPDRQAWYDNGRADAVDAIRAALRRRP